MSTREESERPYQRIAAAIRDRITSGELRAGDRVPSTRQVVSRYGVAMATATRALAVLRDEGLVLTRPGSGTVVRAHEPPVRRPPRASDRVLTRGRIVAAGTAIADTEGMAAASMRRVAAELGVSPMSLYRHVAGREELEHLMVRGVFRANPLPTPGPDGWRAKLELVCRLQWRLYRRHPWLADLMSMTRPPLVPEGMAHTEWILGALSGLGLTPAELAREAVSLPALVHGLAITAAAEVQAERETGLPNDQWWLALDDEVRTLLASGRFPRLAALDAAVVEDLDGMLEHALARHLDGLQARLAR